MSTGRGAHAVTQAGHPNGKRVMRIIARTSSFRAKFVSWLCLHHRYGMWLYEERCPTDLLSSEILERSFGAYAEIQVQSLLNDVGIFDTFRPRRTAAYRGVPRRKRIGGIGKEGVE